MSNFPVVPMSSGASLPGMAYGTGSRWRTTNVNDGSIDDEIVEAVKNAVSAGFRSLDAAENYYNEDSVGKAIKECGVPRSELYVKTKVFTSSKDIPASIEQQLKRLGCTYLDAYLIHTPRIFTKEFPIISVWRELEKLVDQGLVKTIGVSNFEVKHFEQFWDQARIKPALNQIPVYPYRLNGIKETIEYCRAKGITVEAYEICSSLHRPTELGGPLDAVLETVLAELKEGGQNATQGQILLQWASHHGFALVSTTSKPSRMAEYLQASNLRLTDEQVARIDEAGRQGAEQGFGSYNTWKNVNVGMV